MYTMYLTTPTGRKTHIAKANVYDVGREEYVTYCGRVASAAIQRPGLPPCKTCAKAASFAGATTPDFGLPGYQNHVDGG